MTTKMIGIKKFRQNFTSIWKEAQKKDIRYIVMNHSEPVLEVKPITEDDLIVEKWGSDIEKALEDVKNGKFYTNEQIKKEFGIK